jgi:molybdopterin/thiamine biosynthesis adenylyltransferase
MKHAVVKISAGDFAELRSHLLRPDGDEHAAILLCGLVSSARREGFLVRELHLVADEDFSPGTHGYRQIVPRVIAELSGRANALGLSWLSIHSHPLAHDRNALSRDDLASHRRLFPHLHDIVDKPVGGLALGQSSAAGEIWASRQSADTYSLSELEVVGANRLSLMPQPDKRDGRLEAQFDRQARLFGEPGQRVLQKLRVAVIGVGGGGSMIVEQLAHLGVGELVLVDHDIVKDVNLNRIVGSRAADAKKQRAKVEVAQRLTRDISTKTRVVAINGDIGEAKVAEQLRDVDFAFLATDTITSRLVFNTLLHRYLIPGVQIGAKVELIPATDPEVYVAVRPIFADSGCLQCNGLINPDHLQREARTDEERVAQNYLNLPDVVDPAVISLNGIGVSWAVTTMLFWATGLARSSLAEHRIIFPRSGEMHVVNDQKDPACLVCGRGARSHFAAGDPVEDLPIRLGRR